MAKRDVIFLTRILTHYRVSFHEAVRKKLAASGVTYRVAYGTGTEAEIAKGDCATLPWAEPIKAKYFGKSGLVWLECPKCSPEDMIVIGQENSILSNYALQIRRVFGGPLLAFFGHGKNFQAKSPKILSERFKRFWIGKVDWWFAYTERSAAIVESAGYNKEMITVFNNSIDTVSTEHDLSLVSAADIDLAVNNIFGGSRNIGVYIGGLYDLKRLPFLIDSAQQVRVKIPDFQLIIIGGGPQMSLLKQMATELPWIHVLGPKFGTEKALFASTARVFLMPGLVGLGILDSFVYGTPLITTALPYHSPEIDYLHDGSNGVIVESADSTAAYADAVIRVLMDDAWRAHLQEGAKRSLPKYTTEIMADRFSAGVLSALEKRQFRS